MTLVTLQPDDTTGKDTYLGQPNPTFNHGAGVVLAVGFSGAAGTNYKSLIRFDLSSIPAGATITSAVVSLYCIAEDATTDLTLDFRRSLVDWFEGVKTNSAPDGGQDGSTWNLRNANGSVAWGAAGGLSGTDFVATAIASTVITNPGASFDWNVLTDVQDFVNGTATNFGWWVSTASSTTALKTFDSSGSTTAAQRPKLVINYTVVAGTVAGTSTVTGSLTDPQALILQPAAAASKDTRIINDTAVTFNYGVSVQLGVGENNLASQIQRTLIQFDLSSIPSTAVINSATLSLFCSLDRSSNARTYRVYRLKRTWSEGTGDGTATADGATWNTHNGVGNWTTAGAFDPADCEQTDIGSRSFSATETLNAFKVFNLTPTSKADLDLGFGWLIKADTETDDGYIFDSSDSATAYNRPILTVSYYDPIRDIFGQAAGTSTTTATISAIGYAAGSAAGSSTAVGFLISNALFGSISGTSTATARLHGELEAAGAASGSSTTSGIIFAIFRVEGSAAGTSTASAFPSFEGQLRGTSSGAASAIGLMWGRAVSVARVIGCNPVPYLYLTDGSIKNNGQLNILDFLSEGSGFKLQSWRPQISQYKDGGRFSSGPLSQGRRLRYRNYDNVIETFELTAKSRDQDALIEYQQELLAWQEAAADYWVSDFAVSPVYLVAKAAREMNSRYAIIHMISIPELENPYIQPFYSADHAVFTAITPRIERGHWLSTPPGQFECVQISSLRSWTVSGWETGV